MNTSDHTAIDDNIKISNVLEKIASHPGKTIQVEEMIEYFGGRAFGIILLVLSVPAIIPGPPGLTSLFGIPIILACLQIIIGKPEIHLPQFISRRAIPLGVMRKAIRKGLPLLRRIEKLFKPRLHFMTSDFALRILCIFIICLASILLVPLPLTNSAPAAAMTVIAVAIIVADGFYLMLSILLGVFSLVFSFWAIGTALPVAIQWVSSL